MKLTIITTIAFIMLIITPSAFSQNIGKVEVHPIFSNALGVTKNFYIYLPAGYHSSKDHYPSVYFLRTSESEWFDPNAPGRNGKTLRDVLDSLISNGLIGKMIIVGPSTGGVEAWPGLVNMLRPDLCPDEGIGTGKFEDYFIQDLIPYIDAHFRTIPDREHRGIDGFSFGGYCSLLYSFRHPELFCSVGSYDGTMMWYNLDDPAIPGSGPDDPFWINVPAPWMEPGIASMFGSPRNVPYMLQHDATNILVEANAMKLDSIRSIKFHIHSVFADSVGNLSRNLQLTDSMAARGIFNTFSDIILAPGAVHDYGYADLHASKSLIKHWETFQQTTAITENIESIPIKIELFQNYPNPFNPTTKIKYQIPTDGIASLKVYDDLGREVAALVNEEKPTGSYVVEFDASNLASGIYFYKLQAGKYIETKKMVLLK